MCAPSSPTRSPRRAWALGIALLGGAILTLAILGPPAWSPASPLLGRPAPDFVLPIIHGGPAGNRARLSELRGRVVVLDFYASWCVPCREAAAVVKAAVTDQPPGSVMVLGVATADDADAAARFAAETAPDGVAVHDADGAVALAYGADDLPTLVVVNPAGVVVAVVQGVVPRRRLERLIAAALSG